MKKKAGVLMNSDALGDSKEAAALAVNGGLTAVEPLRVCFVCTGNTCRSPMAAAVLNVIGAPYNIYAESAGVRAADGMPIAENALNALLNAGYTPSERNAFDKHLSKRLTEEVLARCDKVVAMEGIHLMALLTEFPGYASRFYTMPKEIPDPYGGSPEDYERSLAAITAGMKELFHFDN